MSLNVAVLLLEGSHAFELGVFCEVFGIDRSDDGLASHDFSLVSLNPGSVPTRHGFDIVAPHGLERLSAAELICVPAYDFHRRQADRVLEELNSAVERGARVLSICTGAFLLGEAGLLDGRRCTTHWRYTDELARRHPRAEVEQDVLYVDDDPVITGAGTAAGVDTCLHFVRQRYGSKAANLIARRMVTAPHREGGQRQFRERPQPLDGVTSMAPVREWAEANLDQELSVEAMARQAHLSQRTFARRFVQETGTSPLQWVTGQRVLLAQQLLETTDAPIAAIARRTGFGTIDNLRHHFTRRVGVTPQQYRRSFHAIEGNS
ncbi:AraC family transcriptional regulator [Arthrobacter sp. SW1]|uniref:GlxA family transcriptional regulator n=1 Tax=Arthrobacter sp. SW1 TaxID=1920889 RepID=UPI000877B917|nr:helix-turn-helix domain-containing protein [Arthrobacter sp. SW1]OFI36753.1 AraC family transcriptional regulator [Arthrobacter sp. SW1]